MDLTLVDQYRAISTLNGQRNRLHQTLRKENYFIRGSDELTDRKRQVLCTNDRPYLTSFMNGSVHCPLAFLESIFITAGLDVQLRQTSFWNMIAYEDDGVRLCVDIDSERVVEEDEIKLLTELFYRATSSYYDQLEDNDISMYTSKCGPRLKRGGLSTGIHIVGHVCSTLQQSLQIISTFKKLLLQNDFNMTGIVVDDGIYKQKARSCSLRMLYSSKIEKCPLCSSSVSALLCELCHGKGRVIPSAVYLPFCSYDRHGFEYQTQVYSGIVTHIRNHSIWPLASTERRTDFHIPVGVQAIEPIENRRSRVARFERSSEKYASVAALEKIQYFLSHTLMDGRTPWKNIQISKVMYSHNERSCIVNVSGDNARMCPYTTKKEHNSSCVWFRFVKSGFCYVHCFSRKNKLCEEPVDRVKLIVPSVLSKLIFNVTDACVQWGKLDREVDRSVVIPTIVNSRAASMDQIRHSDAFSYKEWVESQSVSEFAEQSKKLVIIEKKRKRCESMVNDTKLLYNL